MRRRRQLFAPGADVGEDLLDAFAAAALGYRRDRVNRVASTLVRNAERHLRERRLRDRERAEIEEPLEASRSKRSRLHEAGSANDDVERVDLRLDIGELLGRDAHIVLGVLLYGETQVDLARRLGISHAAARKRFQRVIDRLRESYEGLSHSGRLGRVSPDKAGETP